MAKSKAAEAVVLRFNSLNSDRSVFLSTWQEITNFVMPRKNMILGKRSPGSKNTPVLYDSTAIHANDMLASSLQGAFSTAWFGLDFEEEEFNNDEEGREWLDDAVVRMYKALAKSNFQTESHEGFLDLTSLGTACILIEEKTLKQKKFNGLRFKTFAIDEYVLDEDGEGFVNAIIRKITYTAMQAYKRFGEYAGKEAITNYIKNPSQKIDYVHAIIPKDEFDGKIPDMFAFASITATLNECEIVRKAGYHEFPCVVPRWQKYSKEMYGRSPSWNALADVKTLNRVKMHGLKALAKDIDPPSATPEGVGKLKLTPGAQNIMRADLIDKIKPLLSNARYDAGQIKIEELRQAIKEIYYTDQLQIQKKAQMTATESNITFELMQRLLGPVFGRLGNELYEPATERIFGIMLRAGAFRPIPESISGANVNVKYVGPLAKAQRQAELQAVNAWLEVVATIAGVNPEVIDAVDTDEVTVGAAKMLGVPEKYINSIRKIEEIRKSRADAKAQEQNKVDLVEGAKAFPGVAKAMTDLRGGGM